MPITSSAGDARIVAERLTYAPADGRALLHDITLGFGRERTGVVGPNGSGKTTLVRLLAGELAPTGDSVHRSGILATLPQEFRPPPDAALAVLLGIDERLKALRRLETGDADVADLELVGDEWDLPELAAATLARFGLAHLPLDRPVGAVSGGEATRVALAGLALSRADDAAATRELESARAELRRARRDAQEVRERQARRAAQGRRDRATSNMPKILLNGRLAQAEATGARVRAITEREVEERRRRTDDARRRVEEREPPRFSLPPSGLAAGRTVLELENMTVTFGDVAAADDVATPVLAGVSLRIVGPERVAITGPNGSGKSTLLRVVAGRITPDGGTLRRIHDAEVAYLGQESDGLAGTVLDSFQRAHPDMEPSATRHALALFLFGDEAALQHVDTLSGGERLRAALACAMGGDRPTSLLILDEPTNHLDLDATQALEAALGAWDGALLIVSHDADFLAAVGVEREVGLGAGG